MLKWCKYVKLKLNTNEYDILTGQLYISHTLLKRNILEQFWLHLIARAMPKWWELVEKVTRLPSRVKNPDR